MKCKRHPHEQGGGVCACCLRDRLLALQAAINGTSPGNHHRIPPPPVLFPRSVSPYVSHHRRSNDSDPISDSSDDRHRNRRFHHTPQIAAGDRKHHGFRRFLRFSSIFHHHHDQGPDDYEGSGSWLSSLIHGRRKSKKKKTRPISSPPPPPPPMRKMKSFAVSDRGLSPVRGGDETDDNISESGYSTESSATWRRQTPARRATAERHRRNGGGLGFTVCLSPLVRPGPTSRQSQPPDLAFSGELRSNANPMNNRHVSGVGGGSFGPNRSRKLADRGRFR